MTDPVSPEQAPSPEQARRRGLASAIVAYGWWGLLPIFFHLLGNVGPVEIVSQRVIWSLLLVVAILAARVGLRSIAIVLRDRRVVLALAGSALMIAINWLIYVWAVHEGHIVGASLGYFLNPLVNVALGVLLLKERLRLGQCIALAFAAVGVAILASAALETLWLSLSLAFSFGFYGLIRKLTPVASMPGLAVETLLLAPFALGYMAWIAAQGHMVFGTNGTTTALLIASGAVTTVPLVLFANAARQLPMATLGLLQYMAPTIQFLSGIFLFGEALNRGQLMSFALIWFGLILFAGDSFLSARRNRTTTV